MSATDAATQHSAPGGSSQTNTSALQTEFEFVLPRGYLDANGVLHRNGTMRIARARDEIYPQSDPKVRENPSYLTVILLTRTITKLGTLPEVDTWVVESLFASDLAFLQDLYRRINQEGHTQAAVTCPHCSTEFTVDIAGDASGGS
jgi:hypothetical protein